MQDHFDAMLEQEETRYLVANPRFSALMSAFVMGLGQLFNGQTYRGCVFLFGQLAIILYSLDYAFGWSMSAVMTSLLGAGLYKSFMVFFWVGGFLMWLYNVRDAYVVAEFCRFIFDRSTPILDEDESQTIAEQLAVSTMGVSVHRGMRVKVAFLASAVAIYGIALFYIGSFVSSRSREEGRLQDMIAERPDDAFLHLQLGEIYLSMGGERYLRKAEKSFQNVVELRDSDPASRKIAFTNLSRIYTQRGLEKLSDEMLQKALAQRLPVRGSHVVAIPATPQPHDTADSPDGMGNSPDGMGNSPDGTGNSPDGMGNSPDGTGTGSDPMGAGGRDWARREAAGSDPGASGDGGLENGHGANAGAFTESDLQYVLEASRRDLIDDRPAEAGARMAGLPAEVREDPRVVAVMTSCLLAEGKPVEALALAEARLKKSPEDPGLVVAVAEALRVGGKPAEAEARLQGLLARNGENLEALRALASCYVTRKAWPEADALLGKALLTHPKDMELLHRTYQTYRGLGQMEKAYQTALALADTNCPHVDVFHFIASQSASRSDWNRALVACQELIAREPGKGQWHRLKAEILAKKGDRRMAIATLRDATQLAPGDALLWAKMGDLARDEKALDEASGYYERAERLDGRNVEVLRHLGRCRRDLGKLPEALQSLDKAFALAPTHAAVMYERGRILYLMSRWADAARAFSELFNVAADYEEVAYFLGRSLESAKKYNQAIVAYRQVPQRSRRIEDARMRIGRLAMLAEGEDQTYAAVSPQDGRDTQTTVPTRAVPAATRPVTPTRVAPLPVATTIPTPVPPTRIAAAPTRRPDPSNVPISIGPLVTPGETSGGGIDAYADALRDGELAFREKRWAEALKAYDRVLAVRPAHHRSLSQRGIILRELGRPSEAIASFEAALRQRPDDVDVLMELGQLHAVDLDDGERAIPCFLRVLKLDPKNMACRYSLGLIFEKNKSYEKAEEQYRAIAWYYPTYLKAYDFLGNVLFIQRKFSAAAEQFQKILARDPNDGTVRFKLGLTLLELNDREGARREFRVLKGSLPPENQLQARVGEYLKLLESDG